MPSTVRVWREDQVLPTYLPARPDKNPMFLEKRVYQGSSGRVYPLPFTDRICEEKVDRVWEAVWIENEYLQAMILPELGGRIHVLRDRINGYDLIYRQDVIKPALVGLAGPWISGGIEFNWPQHHRPATFLPVEWRIEEHPDGGRTVWCGDHDPMARMKGLHGVHLRPGSACLELRVRVHNRTPFTQTFLWWANVATRVHAAYQSFFPPDVRFVADHAKRAMSTFPRCDGTYYGVDYGARARGGPNPRWGERQPGDPVPSPDDLSWYANIPTPCSYMAMGSKADFFGGYDHRAQAGLVHFADHRIAPGKKQWTWGNHPFGWAWDRNLTEPTSDGEYRPYIELMAGVFTDNQPDFSFLQPGEVRAWSQYWYPIRQIGPVHQANLEAAVSLILGRKRFRIGVCVTRLFCGALVRLERDSGRAAAEWRVDLAPDRPFLLESPQAVKPWRAGATVLRVLDGEGRELIAYRPETPDRPPVQVPPPATEPPAPHNVASADELYLTGVHLEQYRHATRCPTPYWREALRRDPGDARCHTALGIWHLRRGEWLDSERHLRAAIARWTLRNPNPANGEAHYYLGLCLRYRAWGTETPDPSDRLLAEAAEMFHKAAWNQAWAAAAHYALAEMACARKAWEEARAHCALSLATTNDPRVLNLEALVRRQTGDTEGATAVLRGVLGRDPLDAWARDLLDSTPPADGQTRLDVAHDYARAGFLDEAIRLLMHPSTMERGDLPTQDWGSRPLVEYMLAWLHDRREEKAAAKRRRTRARTASPDYCFPARLEEILVLEAAIRADPSDARAAYYLGNLLYDRRRHGEAMRAWGRAAARDPGYAVVWRNLGIGEFNIRRRPARARTAFERAVRAEPDDARLRYERDQLWKRLGVTPARRLRELAQRLDLVRQRDDLTIEWCALLNQVGRHEEAAAVLRGRRFQPWEGGEGHVLGQFVRTELARGRAALRRGAVTEAVSHFRDALEPPTNLGETWHLLANDSEVRFWLGCAWAAAGDSAAAKAEWRRAAEAVGDFKEMQIRTLNEATRYSGLAWERLGKPARARRLYEALLEHARQLRRAPARIDYFATSLPTMLLFEDDPQERQTTTARFLEAQARLGLGQRARARVALRDVLRREPSHAGAADLLEERNEIPATP